jgi:diguanylate cyclase (GGDEF)-like protein
LVTRLASDTGRSGSTSNREAARFDRTPLAPDWEVGLLRRLAAAEDFVRDGAKRDELASHRDDAAATRDRAAHNRDHKMAGGLRRVLTLGHTSLDRVFACVDALRGEAAADRACAAEDRRLAAEDRVRAAEERAEALDALRGAHFDELTGAYRRALGKQMMEREIDRARRSEQPLAVVIVDVDGLKQVNDTRGHLAGDQLLRDVVDAIRANIRSYEPVVRLGGDEFAFTMTGVSREGAAERHRLMRAEIPDGTFTAGIAELEPDDDLADVLRRADLGLVSSRAPGRRFGGGSR